SIDRKLTHVATGKALTDAVNVGQMQALFGPDAKFEDGVLKVRNGVESKNYTPRYSTIGEKLAAFAEGGTGEVAIAVGKGAVAIGHNSVADKANTVSVGSKDLKRRIVNVGRGTNPTDAVNVEQMDGAIDAVRGTTRMAIDGVRARVEELSGQLAAEAQYDATAATTDLIAVSDDADEVAEVINSSNSLAIGPKAKVVKGSHSVAIGAGAHAAKGMSTAIGGESYANGENAMAVGKGAEVVGDSSVALGAGAKIGTPAYSNVNGIDVYDDEHGTKVSAAVAIGETAIVSANNAMAIGSKAQAGAANAVGLGYNAKALVQDAVAIGNGAKVEAPAAESAVAIGANAIADRPMTVSVGKDGAGQQRALVNVAAGTEDTDAVNLKQIKDVLGAANVDTKTGAITYADGKTLAKKLSEAGTGGANPLAVNYEDADHTQLKLDGTGGGTVISGVKAGSKTGEAVNFDQFDGLSKTVNGHTTKLNNAATTTALNDLEDKLMKLDSTGATPTVMVGAGLAGTVMNITGTDGPRQLIGVSAGNGGDNAVNVAQLKEALGTGLAIGADGKITGYTVDGQDYKTVSGAIEASLKAKGTDVNNGGSHTGTDALAVHYEQKEMTEIKLGGTGGTKVSGVANGLVEKDSQEAVNGGQLHGVIGSVTNVQAQVTDMGKLVDIHDTQLAAHDKWLSAVEGDVNQNTRAINTQAQMLGELSSGVLVKQASDTNVVSIAANTGGTVIDIAGKEGARELTGLKSSTDDTAAATVAQLKAFAAGTTPGVMPTVTYDDESLKRVTFGGGPRSGGAVLAGVADGTIGKHSMEAINGGQLFTYQQEVQKFGEYVGHVVSEHETRLNGLDSTLKSVGLKGGDPDGGNPGSLTVLTGGEMKGEHALAMGKGARAMKDDGGEVKHAVAFGDNAKVTADRGTAHGVNAEVTAENGTAFGENAKATAKNAVALGQDSLADREDTVSVGTDGHNRQIAHVAAATQGSDAVNLDQLNTSVAQGVQQSNTYTDQRIAGVQSQISDVAKNAYAGVAAAMAMPNLTPSAPGKTVVAAGAATYKGASAYAAGATYRSANGRWLLHGAVSTTSRGDAAVRGQVGYEF
ncbi:hypothetical protein C7H84_35760, partial [Burkholderia sp. Nafp2/4-1b]|uniref:YadA-like family protein n=1 Tax=Burkholderia sp. Nafp2/4-1b TaxID=2116686 RepID=UPI000EF8EDAC